VRRVGIRLIIAEKSVVQHASRIYDDLGLEVNSVDHRRVMAVIRYLPVIAHVRHRPVVG